MMRLYVPQLSCNTQQVILGQHQAHYVLHVLRGKPQQTFLLFSETAGEWQAELRHATRHTVTFALQLQTQKASVSHAERHLYFSPLKQQPLSYLITKATEAGVTHLHPCLCERTVIKNLNVARLHKLAIEATEQSGRLAPPALSPLLSLKQHLESSPQTLQLFLLDPKASCSLAHVLQMKVQETKQPSNIGLLLGPEGGWGPQDDKILKNKAHTPVHLGDLVLRAETAATIALGTCAQLLDHPAKPLKR